MRVIEKNNQNQQRNNNQAPKVGHEEIPEVNWQTFRKEVTGNYLKTWIKFAYKELFQAGEETSLRIKDILFLCMDYLDEASKTKQYINLNEKMYKDTDELNK